MNWNDFSRHLFRMAAQLFAAGLIYWVAHSSGWSEIIANEAEGLNTLILLIGSIYAVSCAAVFGAERLLSMPLKQRAVNVGQVGNLRGGCLPPPGLLRERKWADCQSAAAYQAAPQ